MKAVGVIAAAILVVSTVPPFLADRGIGQFGGGIDVVGGLPGFVWIIALSVMMTRRTDVACA
jgi:thymidine phosphorylase